jgi:ADP-ribose pyrophosphatase
METQTVKSKEILYPHVSVDCVLLSVVDDKLCVLLAELRRDGDAKGYKLPGSLIYETEDLDQAAQRILNESTGLKRIPLKQFRSFGGPNRTKNEDDVHWLENAAKLKVGRIVTVAYLALCKVRKKANTSERYDNVQWIPVDELPRLLFDHVEIIKAAVQGIRDWVDAEPKIVFDYMPTKFTAYQLRSTYETIYNKKFDVRNFHKRMNALEYIVPTDEMQEGVPHRSARYYRFDKVKYKNMYSKLSN